MSSAPCVSCRLAPRSRGLICAECSDFACDRHGPDLPISCNGQRVCERCHDRDGCPMGDEDGCCVSCGLTVDCQRGARDGLCGACAVATVGGGA